MSGTLPLPGRPPGGIAPVQAMAMAEVSAVRAEALDALLTAASPSPAASAPQPAADAVSFSPEGAFQLALEAPEQSMRQLGALLEEFEQIESLAVNPAPRLLGELASEIGTAAETLGHDVAALAPFLVEAEPSDGHDAETGPASEPRDTRSSFAPTVLPNPMATLLARAPALAVLAQRIMPGLRTAASRPADHAADPHHGDGAAPDAGSRQTGVDLARTPRTTQAVPPPADKSDVSAGEATDPIPRPPAPPGAAQAEPPSPVLVAALRPAAAPFLAAMSPEAEPTAKFPAQPGARPASPGRPGAGAMPEARSPAPSATPVPLRDHGVSHRPEAGPSEAGPSEAEQAAIDQDVEGAPAAEEDGSAPFNPREEPVRQIREAATNVLHGAAEGLSRLREHLSLPGHESALHTAPTRSGHGSGRAPPPRTEPRSEAEQAWCAAQIAFANARIIDALRRAQEQTPAEEQERRIEALRRWGAALADWARRSRILPIALALLILAIAAWLARELELGLLRIGVGAALVCGLAAWRWRAGHWRRVRIELRR